MQWALKPPSCHSNDALREKPTVKLIPVMHKGCRKQTLKTPAQPLLSFESFLVGGLFVSILFLLSQMGLIYSALAKALLIVCACQ